MTTLYLDTEFNGFNGQFISAALVAEDGREWYQATFCKNPTDWVSKHVIPVIGIRLLMYEELQESLRLFLQKYEEVTIVCDWPKDVDHFCRLLMLEDGSGRMIRTPRLTFVIDTSLNTYTESLTPHNALADARALRLVGLAEDKNLAWCAERQMKNEADADALRLADALLLRSASLAPDAEPSDEALAALLRDVTAHYSNKGYKK